MGKNIVKIEHIGDAFEGEIYEKAEPGTVFVLELDAVIVTPTSDDGDK